MMISERPPQSTAAAAGAVVHTTPMDPESQSAGKSNALTSKPRFGTWDFGMSTQVTSIALQNAAIFKGKASILPDVTAQVHIGHTLGVFGGSKQGRNMLLNALSGNIESSLNALFLETRKGQTHRGEQVKANARLVYIGRTLNALFPCSSPLEELALNLSLRDATLRAQEIERRSMVILQSLGLADVKSKLVKQLSALQKKLLMLAVALCAAPDVVCLEDPFEGIPESPDRLVLARTLAALGSSQRCLVVYSSPSCEAVMFEYVQHLLLLDPQTNTLILAQASAPHGKEALAVGPGGVSPVDYALLNVDPREPSSPSKARTKTLHKVDVKQSANSSSFMAPIETSPSGQTPGETSTAASVFQTFQALMKREFVFVKRDPRLLLGRMLSAAFVSITGAIVFLHVADQSQPTYSAISHVAAYTMVIFLGGVGATLSNSILIAETKIAMLHQSRMGLYSPALYFAVRFIPEVLVNFLVSCFSILITYWSVQWNTEFFYIVAILFLFLEVCISYSHFIGYFFDALAPAAALASASLLPQFLFIGSFVRIAALPAFIQWLSYVCTMNWATRLLLVREFDPSKCTTPLICGQWRAVMTGNLVVIEDQWWYFLTFILAFFVPARLAALRMAYSRLGRWRSSGIH